VSTMTRTRYLRELYERLVCAHCGKNQWHGATWWMLRLKHPKRPYQIILHHPDGDGDLGRVGNIPASDPNWKARIDAEVARCMPLCWSCHGKEHERLRAAAGEPTARDRMIALKKLPRTTTAPGNVWVPPK
jgi:hypothetical protein